MGREIRLIRALADEGYQYGLNGGEPPIPRDRMVRFASLPKPFARQLMDEIEAGGVPVVMLRGDGAMNPDGVRDYDLLVPASVETLVTERHAASRARPTTRVPRHGARRTSASTASSSHPRSREGAAPAGHARERARRWRDDRRDRAGAGDPAGRRAGRHGRGRRRPRAAQRRAADLPRRGRAGRTARWPTSAGPSSSSRSSRSTRTRAAAAGRGSRAPRRPSSPSGCYERFAAAIRTAGLTVATGSFGAEMQVELVNDGPFTIWLDSADR